LGSFCAARWGRRRRGRPCKRHHGSRDKPHPNCRNTISTGQLSPQFKKYDGLVPVTAFHWPWVTYASLGARMFVNWDNTGAFYDDWHHWDANYKIPLKDLTLTLP